MAASLDLCVSWWLSQTCKRFLNAKLSPKQYHQIMHLQQLTDGQEEESLIHSAEQWMWKPGTTQLKENLHTLQTELSMWKAYVQTCKKERKPSLKTRTWNTTYWCKATTKLLYVRKYSWVQYINSLTDCCHWTSGSTSYCLEVIVQLAFKHLFV